MSNRRRLLNTGNIYHVFNKTIESKTIFKDQSMCIRFLELLKYYRSLKAKISFSKISKLDGFQRDRIIVESLMEKYFKVEILAFCLMPTHFHLILKQKIDKGIEQFCSDLINAFTRYFNIRSERKGPIFLTKFKTEIITSDEQLKHVSRYIHLNPYSSGLVSFNGISTYPWSSYMEYLKGQKNNICNTEFILKLFNENRQSYRKFVEDNADYQKELEKIKYIIKKFGL